jgi:hypothetical protein
VSTRIGFAVVAAFGFVIGWLCCFLDGVISSKSGEIAIGVPDAPPKVRDTNAVYTTSGMRLVFVRPRGSDIA